MQSALLLTMINWLYPAMAEIPLVPWKCLAEKFKDSVEQGETGLIASNFFTHDELGSDCALDIEDGDIDNAWQKLDDFFVWAYEDCQTEGSQVLSKLRFRCDRINDIREEIADRVFIQKKQ